MRPESDEHQNTPDVNAVAGVAQELENQAALLVSVATGGAQIADKQHEYQDRRRRLLRALERFGLEYPFPWADLWQWHGHWSGGTLPTYASRRVHIRQLVTPTIDALDRKRSGLAVADPGAEGLPAWATLDARVADLAIELSRASTRDDLQDVGRRAREILIDCARLIEDPALVPPGDAAPKAGDAKAWLDLFLGGQADGSSRAELRRLIRAAWDLAQKVTHGDLDRVDAFAAAQATILVVRALQELASRPAKPSG